MKSAAGFSGEKKIIHLKSLVQMTAQLFVMVSILLQPQIVIEKIKAGNLTFSVPL